MKVYFDNAATTPLDPDVFEEMKPLMLDMYGNPSSTHAHGREVRTKIEYARRKVAELLNTVPAEIFFTSGGTEADNTAIRCTVEAYDIKHIITTSIEHHAVGHTVERLVAQGKVKASYVELDGQGHVNMDHLEQLLKSNPNSLVSIMHANNEIGTINDIEQIGDLAKEYGATFHSDTVQTMGHYVHDLKQLNCQFIVGAAHKFHGPKGVGFLRVCKSRTIGRFIEGGGQERNHRGGTENVYGIVGLAKALEIAYAEMESHQKHVQSLKTRMIEKLRENIPGVEFNGDISPEGSLYTVLNVSFPPHENNGMLLFSLDINGISASGGSACSSGANKGSHVLNGIKADPNRQGIRFSFSKYNTIEEVDYTVNKLVEILVPEAVS
ncbi:cysteine desulfurase family protein [Roseivirga sp. UBA838]|uniref:cysteine desulfurase family protein n=1 Tax=Roseivirga sp. UBA838 TaxID=1947393 RepID=UPI00257D6721|nr:cysteine desulfurase family protein [Roseivirga sp. UBA838]|tara:strand:+ start:131718 stop:132860 length:1143 start_codon:yes stop_codon:yes gene_type:complete